MDPLTMAMVGSAGASLLSGLGGFFGGQKTSAANTQAAGLSAMIQQQAIQQAQQNYNAASSLLKPYATGGTQSLDLLMKYLQGGAQGIGGGGPSLISTFSPTMEQLAKTPGYQFALTQGLGAVQNAAAAKGLGSSGNALQGGVNYAQGLASTTFQQQLQNYLEQNKQAFNMLYTPAQLGQGAAAANMQGTGMFNQALLGGATNLGNTLAGGTMGSANAQAGGLQSLFGGAGSALSSAASMPFQAQMLSALSGGQYANPFTQFGMGSPAFRGVVGGAGPLSVPTI